MDYDPKNPLLQPNETQAFDKLFNVESEFMAIEGYNRNDNSAALRGLVVTLIDRLSKCKEFDAFVPYLAVNYFDRFLSRQQELPVLEENANNNLKLFAICCVSIAWKMRSMNFSVIEFLKSRKLDTNPEMIMMMELHILNALEWRMRSLTAICFMEYFFPYFKLRDPQPIQGFTRRDISQAIIASQGDIKFTQFKPSVIAASALLSASYKVFPAQFLQFQEAVFKCPRIDQDAMLLCMEAMGTEGAQGIKEAMGTEGAKGNKEVRDTKYKGKDKVIEIPQPETWEAMSPSVGASEPPGQSPLRIHEAGSSGGRTTKTTGKEDVVMNFELNWPKAELEEGLYIPEPEPEPKPPLHRRAAAAVAAEISDCCPFL